MSRKPRSRVRILVEAAECSAKVTALLAEIDLRATSGELREAIAESRIIADNLTEWLDHAISLDVPLRARVQHKTPTKMRAASA